MPRATFINSRHEQLAKLQNTRALQPEERYELEELEREQTRQQLQSQQAGNQTQQLMQAGFDLEGFVEKLRSNPLFRLAVQFLLEWATRAPSPTNSPGMKGANPSAHADHLECCQATLEATYAAFQSALYHYSCCCQQRGVNLQEFKVGDELKQQIEQAKNAGDEWDRPDGMKKNKAALQENTKTVNPGDISATRERIESVKESKTQREIEQAGGANKSKSTGSKDDTSRTSPPDHDPSKRTKTGETTHKQTHQTTPSPKSEKPE